MEITKIVPIKLFNGIIKMKFFGLFNIVFFSLTFLLFFFFLLTSIREGEKKATKRTALFIFINLVLIILVFLTSHEINLITFLILSIFSLIVLTLFLMPFGKPKVKIEIPQEQVDERDIPFSRIRLIPNSSEFESYYKLRPENLKIDERIRKLPGLLSKDAKYANKIAFSASDSSFDFIETFRNAVDWSAQKEPNIISKEKFSWQIKQLTKYYGAHSVGITALKPYHIYSHIGRGTGKYGDPIKLDHKFAIAFSVEMNHRMIRSGPKSPAVMESAKQYVEAARVAMQLTIFLSKIGYSARAHIDGNYRIIAPLVARDAGLGEIGRMGLLITPDLGPRVRIGVVTTDAPLHEDIYQPNTSIIDFCNICKKCAENCPSGSIPFDERKDHNGALRWQIDWMGCFQYWSIIGTDCCRCMAVCPYSHPNNFPHNLVRLAIQRSGFVRRAALKFDDLIYSRIPEEFKLPKWLEENPE